MNTPSSPPSCSSAGHHPHPYPQEAHKTRQGREKRLVSGMHLQVQRFQRILAGSAFRRIRPYGPHICESRAVARGSPCVTVLLGAGRAFGALPHLTWRRALPAPVRPCPSLSVPR